jgi:hypothetical protein
MNDLNGGSVLDFMEKNTLLILVSHRMEDFSILPAALRSQLVSV